MNDRALWRGKRVDTGEWIVGNLLGETEILIINKITKEITGFEIDPSTLGQCTSLKDKNDNRIFEGDVLKDMNEKEFIIGVDTFHGVQFKKYAAKHIDNKNRWCILCRFDGDCSEVIGNIHNNPEILRW